MAENSLTQDYIKSILNYDPETRKSAIIRHGYHENHGNHKCLT